MIYAIDIDGTICHTNGNDYPNSQPIQTVIDKINDLYHQGAIIKIFTARGSSSGIDWRALTKEQLKSWGVQHHELIMGKPTADVFVDDKAISPASFCPNQPYLSPARIRSIRNQ